MRAKATRRRVLKGAVTAFAAAVAARLPIKFEGVANAQVSAPEIYEGFMLLSAGEVAPASAGKTNRIAPQVESLDGAAIPMPDVRREKDFAATAQAAGIAMYAMPEESGYMDAGGVLTYEITGKLFSASAQVSYYAADRDRWEPYLTLVAEPRLVRPVPIWNGGAAGDREIALTKATFLPTPGLAIQAGNGFVGQWLEEDVRYTLMCHKTDGFQGFQELVGKLRRV